MLYSARRHDSYSDLELCSLHCLQTVFGKVTLTQKDVSLHAEAVLVMY